MSAPMNAYYIYQNDQQHGPFAMDQLKGMLESGTLQETDLCWNEGMTDWQPVATALPGLLVASPRTVVLPPIPPSTTIGTPHSQRGGIGRASFGAILLALCGTLALLSYLPNRNAGAEKLADLAVSGVFLIFITLRLYNTGHTLWIMLMVLVPKVHILFLTVLGIYTLMAPEGHAQTKKLDAAGKAVAWAMCGIAVLYVLALVTGVFKT